MCLRNYPNHKPFDSTKRGDRQKAICGGIKCYSINESSSSFYQHYNSLRVQKRWTHGSIHNSPRQNANARAASWPCNLCWLYPLVPPRGTRHVERVPLHTYNRPHVTKASFFFFFSFSFFNEPLLVQLLFNDFQLVFVIGCQFFWFIVWSLNQIRYTTRKTELYNALCSKENKVNTKMYAM